MNQLEPLKQVESNNEDEPAVKEDEPEDVETTEGEEVSDTKKDDTEGLDIKEDESKE